jgi:hypothetical protein
MWRNMMRSTKSQKASILYYSIDYPKKKVGLRESMPPSSNPTLHLQREYLLVWDPLIVWGYNI